MLHEQVPLSCGVCSKVLPPSLPVNTWKTINLVHKYHTRVLNEQSMSHSLLTCTKLTSERSVSELIKGADINCHETIPLLSVVIMSEE